MLTVMKELINATLANDKSVVVSNPFTWENLIKLHNKSLCLLPAFLREDFRIKTVSDMKQVVWLFAVLFAAFLAAGICDMILAQEGGMV